jgi:hypothetical protein
MFVLKKSTNGLLKVFLTKFFLCTFAVVAFFSFFKYDKFIYYNFVNFILLKSLGFVVFFSKNLTLIFKDIFFFFLKHILLLVYAKFFMDFFSLILNELLNVDNFIFLGLSIGGLFLNIFILKTISYKFLELTSIYFYIGYTVLSKSLHFLVKFML